MTALEMAAETERITALRREWFGELPPKEETAMLVEPYEVQMQIVRNRVAGNEVAGIRYQRCGGGVRINRRKRGND